MIGETKPLPESLQGFMADEAARRFAVFHAAVVAHCVEYLYPDGDGTRTPNFRRVLAINALVGEASRAARIAAEAAGMTAKIDTGQRTRSHGRVLEVGKVVQMVPVLWRGTRARNRLRMTRPDGRTVVRLVRVMRVHRLSERRVG